MAGFVGFGRSTHEQCVGETDMIAEPKRKPHHDLDRDERERRRRQEAALDEALANTFPASDPVSAEQPAPPERAAADWLV